MALAFDVALSQLSENRELLCRGMCPAVVRGAHLLMQVQGSPSRHGIARSGHPLSLSFQACQESIAGAKAHCG